MGLFRRRVRMDIHLAARVQPMHRGEIYEDPLMAVLANKAPGSKIVGGGSELDLDQGVLSCDIELAVTGAPDEGLAIVTSVLEDLGAPIGSFVRMPGRDRVPFGVTHGYGLELDGVNQPAAVYEENDPDDLIAALGERLEGIGVLQSWWEGPRNTVLYYYARDGDALRDILHTAASLSPLARGSRIFSTT